VTLQHVFLLPTLNIDSKISLNHYFTFLLHKRNASNNKLLDTIVPL